MVANWTLLPRAWWRDVLLLWCSTARLNAAEGQKKKKIFRVFRGNVVCCCFDDAAVRAARRERPPPRLPRRADAHSIVDLWWSSSIVE